MTRPFDGSNRITVEFEHLPISRQHKKNLQGQDIGKVAHEMGSSPGRVREDYNNPKSETEALRYFSIKIPKELAKVIPFAVGS